MPERTPATGVGDELAPASPLVLSMNAERTVARRLAFGLGYEVLKRGSLANLTLADPVAEVLKRSGINVVMDVGADVVRGDAFLRAMDDEDLGYMRTALVPVSRDETLA